MNVLDDNNYLPLCTNDTPFVFIVFSRGMTGKRIRYSSVPYQSIRAFALQTAGSVDTDQELIIHARGIGKVSLDLVNSVDIIPIQQFLSKAVIQGKGAGENAAGAFAHDNNATTMSSTTGWMDVLGSNYRQIDVRQVESRLKSNPNILLADEKVELAFKCGRDSFILTSHRILKIDVQGMTGKKIEYLTILWPAIKGFSSKLDASCLVLQFISSRRCLQNNLSLITALLNSRNCGEHH